MSEKEYTKIIIKKIWRTQVFEWIMMFLMTLNIISLVAHYLPDDLVNKSIANVLYSMVFGPTQLIFIAIFCYQMSEVNKQFHRLF